MHADTVFLGGPVHTVDAAHPWCTAVAVRGGRITATGREHDVRDLIGPRTEVVDLHGRLLLPGFQDAHVHPVFAGLQLLECDLSSADSADGYLRVIADYAARHPERAWITGGGWTFTGFGGPMPTRDQLDTVVGDRPAYLSVRDVHSAWVNSRALELAGIDERTDDPVGGRIERDGNGRPTGVLHEQAMSLVARLLPEPSAADLQNALACAQRHLHALGVTAWQDALVGSFGGQPDPFDVYLEGARSGLLTARVRAALWWDPDRGQDQLDDLIERRGRGRADRFTAGAVKMIQDGIPENGTAALTEPYLDNCGCPTANRGLSMVEPALLNKAVAQLDSHGFQLHFHAIGDRALTEILDALEYARVANGDTGLRHHIAHLQVVRPEDIPRFRALGATATIQPLWAAHDDQMDDLCIPVLGRQRAAWQFPFGDLRRAGVALAGGSDWGVTSADPVLGIHVAVNRVLPGAHGERDVFLPEQRIDLAAAIHAYTSGSAYVNHLDDTGSVTVGNRADLVLLDRNPFDEPPEDIAGTRVLRTYVEGTLVHAAD
ncbi:amidohydrolase [Streptomyces sp. NPDC091215]|uniref:amidohydrolase n=1 Tax=Streptomyces sp. NPDC091215 TaxID=3155192 RepID=UPI0034475747